MLCAELYAGPVPPVRNTAVVFGLLVTTFRVTCQNDAPGHSAAFRLSAIRVTIQKKAERRTVVQVYEASTDIDVVIHPVVADHVYVLVVAVPVNVYATAVPRFCHHVRNAIERDCDVPKPWRVCTSPAPAL